MRAKLANRAAFTLIEILIVVSLLTMTSLAVMTSFLQGIKIFNRFNDSQDGLEKAFLIEKLTHDVKNSANDPKVPWVVSTDSLSFASVSTVSSKEEDAAGVLPARIRYYFDPEKKAVIRTEVSFPFDRASAQSEVLAESIQSLKFNILRDNEEKPPSRVTVTLEYGDAPDMRILKKDILVPIGYVEVQA